MRRDIAHYVACCDTFSRVKIEHQKPAGLLKPLEIPVWKWEDISMDFIVGFPQTLKGNNSIWVIVARLTKVAHFVPVKITFGTERLANLYVEHILRLHGAPKSIVFDQGSRFVTKFWRSFHKLMGTTLSYNTTFHPQIDGQLECQPSSGGHATSLCAHLRHGLGDQLTVCRVLIQQHLSSKSPNVTF
jgi:hypothetical protein